MYHADNPQSLEKYSSAVTLSDMELFIFPDLLQALVLANIMSPALWEWRHDRWFSKMHSANPYRRIQRLKQFIMNNYTFNLDLDTWGLTDKQTELKRFAGSIDETILARSNALFGYEGDRYYFDIDIRRHFGLDKYTSDIIPYWKTETLEAMNAFRYKEGYPTGAGECVSLSTLYAAALFVVAGIPLEDIFLMATPLHSQNFIDVSDGILTNNRRIVTRTMWYNGTELSAKAQRALRNEQVTMVSHTTGSIHAIYPDATIQPSDYERFSTKLRSYLKTDIDFSILTNFLRHRSHLQHCFQFSHRCCGKPRFIEAETVYHYEHGSANRVNDDTRITILHEIDEDEFYTSPISNRIVLDELEQFFRENRLPVDDPATETKLTEHLHHSCYQVHEVVSDLIQFCVVHPRLPDNKKTRRSVPPVRLTTDMSRENVVAALMELRELNEAVDCAFSAYRDMRHAPWKPFLKAALTRNPVSVEATRTWDIPACISRLNTMPNESIYDGTRLAQPDEVWNFQRGDGLEKALCLMNIIRHRDRHIPVSLQCDGHEVIIETPTQRYRFHSLKNVPPPGKNDFVWDE